MARDAKGLTPYQAAYVEAYLLEPIGAKAMVAAGYKGPRPDAAARRMMARAHVVAEIERRRTESNRKLRITREAILERLARIAYGDVRRLYDADGKPRPIMDLSDDEAALISGFDVLVMPGGTTRIVKYRIADQRKAAEALARISGIEEPHRLELMGRVGAIVYLPDNGRGSPPDRRAPGNNPGRAEKA